MLHLVMVVLLAALFLGCGNQGVGVSTDSQSSQGASQGSQLNRSKTMSVESRTVVTITVPVVPLIGEAWGELVVENDKQADANLCEGLWHKALAKKPLEEQEKADALVCAFTYGWLYAFTPTMGWPVSPKSEEGSLYMVASLAHVLAANNVASEVAAQLNLDTYSNMRVAKTQIKELLKARYIYFNIVYAWMPIMSEWRSTADLSGKTESVAFSKGVYYIALGAGGAVLKYSGVDWFGNGNLSGKRYETQLASLTGVAMSKGKTVTNGAEQKIGESSKAQAGVGK